MIAPPTAVAEGPVPKLDSVSPAIIAPDNGWLVQVKGANFVEGMSFLFGSGVSATGKTKLFGTTAAEVPVMVQAGTALGDRSVMFSYPSSSGTVTKTSAVTLRIGYPVPDLKAMTPANLIPKVPTTVTLSGSNLYRGVTFGFGPAAPASSGPSFPTHQSATTQVTALTPVGTRSLVVYYPGATPVTTKLSFSVKYPVPSITAISPASVVRGTGATLTISGTNLYPGVMFELGSGILASGSAAFSGSTSASLPVQVQSTAPLGAHPVTVIYPNNSGGTTKTTTSVVLQVVAPKQIF